MFSQFIDCVTYVDAIIVVAWKFFAFVGGARELGEPATLFTFAMSD
jgi:hypothetical protein